jgi:hypothetical protein
VDDPVGDGRDSRRRSLQRLHRLRVVVLADDRELEAGGAGVDDED